MTAFTSCKLTHWERHHFTVSERSSLVPKPTAYYWVRDRVRNSSYRHQHINSRYQSDTNGRLSFCISLNSASVNGPPLTTTYPRCTQRCDVRTPHTRLARWRRCQRWETTSKPLALYPTPQFNTLMPQDSTWTSDAANRVFARGPGGQSGPRDGLSLLGFSPILNNANRMTSLWGGKGGQSSRMDIPYIVIPRACRRSHAQVGGGRARKLCPYNNYASGWHTQPLARSTHTVRWWWGWPMQAV